MVLGKKGPVDLLLPDGDKAGLELLGPLLCPTVDSISQNTKNINHPGAIGRPPIPEKPGRPRLPQSSRKRQRTGAQSLA